MKIKKILLMAIIPVILLSCENPIGLGMMLDIYGPELELEFPSPRSAVSAQFDLKGKVSDTSGISKLLITVNGESYPKQWRYQKGFWEVSEDKGASWTAYNDAVWTVKDKDVTWSVPIDMSVNGKEPDDGEYMFSVQAWDTGNQTDDNSFKTIILIIDKAPPSVQIINPYLNDSRFAFYDSALDSFDNSKLQEIHGIDETDKVSINGDKRRFDPAYIGRFITQSFPLQWQIDDNHDIWSIDIRFYKHDFYVDQNPMTIINDADYIYKYHKNIPPPPVTPNPAGNISPNGSVTVPALNGKAGFYGEGELLNPVDGKTTVKVVSVCYDAAGNPNEEKVLGYFVYWPAANEPWITFPEGMNEYSYYEGMNKTQLDSEFIAGNLLMIYPGRSIKATAFHAHGLKEVKFSLYKYSESSGEMESTPLSAAFTDQVFVNPLRPNGTPSNIFPWEFVPPPSTGFYVIKAHSYSYTDIPVPSAEYVYLFHVQDISFPDFPVSPEPNASTPLFESITADNSIIIKGLVRDATNIANLTLVWINPESVGFAAMSQLSYFRDKEYKGWKTVLNDPNIAYNTYKTEGELDPNNPNKVWKLQPEWVREDYDTTRQEFSYSIKIPLSHLNIAANGQSFGLNKPGEQNPVRPLVSQVFLLRAENPDGKTTIITYAPQGDTLPPRIGISYVTVTGTGRNDHLEPGEYNIISPLVNGNTITIFGTWEDDSAKFLNIDTHLKPRMKFSVNGYNVTGLGTNISLAHSPGSASGTFTVTGTLGETNTLKATSLKDTIAVSADVTDIGGNFAEDAASWLIKSDDLKFLRVTSTNQSDTYTTGDTIEIYFEFSKPVKLSDTTANPRIRLNAQNSDGTYAYADYKAGQLMEDTRQYFVYTVQQGFNVTALNVNNLETNAQWNASSGYPFIWEHTLMEEDGKDVMRETIRVTMASGHSGGMPAGANYFAHTLPVSGTFSLTGSRNIKIDTLAPVYSSRTATPAGWHTTGAEIFINVTFSKPVRAGTGDNAPYLTILGNKTSTAAEDIRVNNNIITFKYTVAQNDTTNGVDLTVTGSGGVITDLYGTAMTGQIGSPSPITLTGIIIDTAAPAAPTVEIRNSGSVISSNVGGTSISGTSGGVGLTTGTGNQWPTAGSAPADVNNLVNLQTIYYNDLSLLITRSGQTNDQDLNKLEYSVNYGSEWQDYSTGGSAGSAVTWGSAAPNGVYQITARQIDRAGNVSNWAKPVAFNWDKGDNLVSRIDSFTPNGVYTFNDARQTDQVEIVLQLRKQINVTNAQITLNARNSNNIPITVNALSTGNNLDRLTFRYNVANGDTTNNLNLTVTAVSITATDSTNVNVTSFASKLPASSLILPGKAIKIQTGGLTVYNNAKPAFISAAKNGDESYSATLTLEFERHIYRREGSITIAQHRSGYRLPAVLTEAQAARFSGITGFNDYYTRGTNGYIYTSTTDRGADTTTKYILNFNIDTTNTNYQPTSDGTGGNAVQQMAEAFRLAESVTIPITSTQFVAINNNTNTGRGTLNITLTGSNALQVLGGSYTVIMPKGLVQDELSNESPQIQEDLTTTLTGTSSPVARPFIRVRKTQDTISVAATPGTSQPRFIASQPFQASVRMDSRTPDARIFYIAANAVTTTNAVNWSVANGPSGTTAAPAQPADPRTTTTNRNEYTAVLSIGTADDYQGLQWYARARATSGNGTVNSAENTWSVNSEQMAFKTVVTYVASGIAAGDTGVTFESGDQLWIRGGDAIGSSSIPGYPLTWEDTWSASGLQNKRAGIKLFTRTSTGTLANSTYKWITWEITVDTYFDIILGRDNDSSANQAWQYGPRGWAYQRAGWTSYKLESRILPGQHRWLVSNNPDPSKGTLNFSGTLMARSDLAVNYNNRVNQADPNTAVP